MLFAIRFYKQPTYTLHNTCTAYLHMQKIPAIVIIPTSNMFNKIMQKLTCSTRVWRFINIAIIWGSFFVFLGNEISNSKLCCISNCNGRPQRSPNTIYNIKLIYRIKNKCDKLSIIHTVWTEQNELSIRHIGTGHALYCHKK